MYKVVCVGTFHQKGLDLLASRPDLLAFEVLAAPSPENIARSWPSPRT